MFPLLKPGDEILYDFRAYFRKPPEVGDIVVARHPSRRELKIVKRVSRVHENGTFDLQGENPFESTDFNAVPRGKILGKVTCIFYPAASRDEQNRNKVN